MDRLTKTASTSEKNIEKYLTDEVKKRGGLSLKYHSGGESGYPDRIVILPGRPAFWVELKSKGERPRPLQQHRIEELRALGQKVYVADSKTIIDLILQRNEI